MTVGISWIILGIANLFIYQQKRYPIQKTIALSLLIPGIIMFIAGLVNIWAHSMLLTMVAVLPIIPAGFWVLYKMKQWHEAMDVMDKLTDRRKKL